MALSIAGLLVCCAIMVMALRSSAPIVVALIMSLAFGATAIVSLPALGGSSPMIYVVFVFALLGSVVLRRDLNRDLTTLFSQQPAAWLLVILGLYAVFGSYLLPRIFAGETTAFIPEQSGGGIVEVPLVPVNGNITQTLYLLLGILSSIALGVLLLERKLFIGIRQGFLACATLHVVMGFMDLFGKLVGVGDVLAPIRTASYAMLTDAGVAGFWRIAGAYSEASAFGSATVVLLAFTFSYWRGTRDRLALALTLSLVALLVLSTSSTAYVAGAILLLCVMGSVANSAFRDRLSTQDVVLLGASIAMLSLMLGIVLYDEKVLDPISRLFDAMVLNKAYSASGQERAYWNYQSLMSLYDTVGLGMGLGSSRASSWLIAVVSQLGIVGSLMIGLLLLAIVRADRFNRSVAADREIRAIALSVRSACLAGVLTSSLSGGNADPGMFFFIGVAVVLGYQRQSMLTIASQGPGPASLQRAASANAVPGSGSISAGAGYGFGRQV